jgi:hypothetical protein
MERFLALFVFGHFEKETGLFETCPVFFPSVYNCFKRGLLFQNDLRFIRVVPEIGARSELIELVYALLLRFEVKDASAKVRGALLSGQVVLWFLPTSVFYSFNESIASLSAVSLHD